MNINLKAIKCAWIYTISFLVVWTIYDHIQTRTWGLAFLLLITQNFLLMAIKYFLRWKLGKDEE
ncbi:hypothetical protein G9F73_019675 [Clostridium estertheticum]|uniref:hypothetical protein n=1 Tax=Clostridium estertheticum TaxID=238834 RepID=UPI001CC9072F|nr:hypothetical protein [Clostridium estertheticum]MBZ9609947.1 hypothetical protein [Clostridium estertheticum]